MDAKEIVDKYREHLYGLGTYYKEPLPFVRGEGKWLFDADGTEVPRLLRRHRDRVASATATRGWWAAIEKQARTLQHVSTLFPTIPIVELAETLAGLFPGEKPAKCFFTNSGTEAIETAILTARVHTQRTEVIALRHGYHGRIDALDVAHRRTRAGGWAASTTRAIRHAMAPYCYRCPLAQAGELRHGLRAGRGGGHPHHDLGPAGRLHRRADHGRGRLHRPAQGVLRRSWPTS